MAFAEEYGFKRLLSDKRQLNGRQIELDVVRGISVFLMVGVHVVNVFHNVTAGGEMGTQGNWFELLAANLTGAFPGGANCFMMVMGMVMLFSTTATYKHFIKRGAMLIGAGFMVEIIRLIPQLVNLALTGDFVSFYPEYSYATDQQLIILTLFWQDIFIFAGMAMMFIGIMQKLKVSDLGLVLITAAMVIASQFLQGMDTGNDAVNILCGYFWGTTIFDGNMTTSRYPMFAWIIYPVSGYLVAKVMVRAKDKHLFYRNLAVWSAIVLVPLTIGCLMTGVFDGGFSGKEAYFSGILPGMWCTAAGFLWIAFIYWASLKIPEKILAPVERWSRNITLIYVIHFAILAVLLQVLPSPMNLVLTIVLFLALFAVTDFLAEKVQQRKRESRASAC